MAASSVVSRLRSRSTQADTKPAVAAAASYHRRMTITLVEFALATVTGIAAGWVWTSPDAHVLEPIRSRVNRSLRRSGSLGRWLAKGSECAPCAGFWPQFALLATHTGLTLITVQLAAAALMLHIAWQLISGLIGALILR